MKYAALIAALCLPFFACEGLSAGEYNEVLSVGDAAPGWEGLPGTDGKSHSLAELADKSIVVVIFTCRSCPTAADYEARIADLVRQHADNPDKLAVIPISANLVEEDKLPALIEHVEEADLPFHFLHDESQQVAKSYGAVFTPQFFVLNSDRKIVYMGAMDDATNPEEVTRHYVNEAIAAIEAGSTPEVTETIARGCRIRFVSERRRRAQQAK